jgi:hypothetical protein
VAVSFAFLLIIAAVLIGLAALVAVVVAVIARGSQRHPRLIGCPSCGRNVLPEAAACPNCGQTVAR